MQLPVKNQNGSLNSVISENLNFSSSESFALADGSCFSAFRFKITIPIPFNHEKTHIKNPVNKAIVKLFWAKDGTILAFKTEPALEIVKVSPKAKLSSFPLNHWEMIAD